MSHSLPKILDGALEQALAQPALVGYRDFGRYQCVGRVSDVGEGSKAKVTLFICRDVETKRKLLIYLHVPLARRNWKNVRDLYLVIPVEKLQLIPDVLHAGDIAQFRPDQLKKDGLNSIDEVLRVKMELGCPAYAVMPSLPRGAEAPLEGLQGQLLLHWRNLSNLTNMEVYLSDTSAIDHFHTINMKIRDGQLTTPELDLNHMYQGCRGVMNNWEQYPCNESSGYPLTWNPCLDQAPPPYDDVAPRQPKSDRFPPVGQKCSPEITWRDTSQPLHEARMVKDAGQPSHPRKRKATEALAEDSDRPAVARDAFKGTMIPDTPTQADPSSQDSAPSSHFGDSSAAEPEWTSQVAEIDDAIRASLLRRRGTDNAHKANNVNDQPPVTRLDPCAPLNEPRLALELQEWILAMWHFDPRAHDAHRDDLLHLGLLARDGGRRRQDQVARFDAAKAELQARFLERSAGTLTLPGHRPLDLRRDARAFVGWLEGRVCRGAVTLLAGPLREMYWAMGAAGAEGGEGKGGGEAYFEEKARCCALAFVAFGGRV